MNIALVGLKGSGKSTVAQLLRDDFGYLRASIAKPTKDLVRQWLSLAGVAADLDELKRDVPAVRGVLEAYAEALQALAYGGHADRLVFVRRIVEAADATGLPVVVEDARMPWECEEFLRSGWLVAKVVRSGLETSDAVTERLVDGCPCSLTLRNVSDLRGLAWSVTAVVHALASADGPADRRGSYAVTGPYRRAFRGHLVDWEPVHG